MVSMVWYGMVWYGKHNGIEEAFKPNLDDGQGPRQYSLSRLFSLFSLYNYW